MWIPSLGQEDNLEEGMATRSSILAWRIPWTEEPGELQSMALHSVEHDWNDFTCTEYEASSFLWELCLFWTLEYKVLKPGTFAAISYRKSIVILRKNMIFRQNKKYL